LIVDNVKNLINLKNKTNVDPQKIVDTDRGVIDECQEGKPPHWQAKCKNWALFS